jgi:hypothetical protein
VLVTAEQFALPAAHGAFTEDGRLQNEGYQTMVEAIGARTARLAQALKTG